MGRVQDVSRWELQQRINSRLAQARLPSRRPFPAGTREVGHMRTSFETWRPGEHQACVVPLTSPSITDLLARLFGGKLQLACLCPVLCSLLQMCAPGCTGVQSTQDPTSKYPAFSEWCAVTFLTFRTLEQVWNKYS